ncbi:MAG: DNA polymerase III subunit alpha [Chloroflexi bacterium]|nr:DNA polymerase III subunit alpha [Chloroflexota bacterium]
MNNYAELHCHSNFSLLDGASQPEMLAAQAAELGMPALALTDHNGLYGIVPFYKAAREAGIKPVIGSELTLATGHHVTLLAKNNRGYSNLCRLITKAQLGHSKGEPSIDFPTLASLSENLFCLSGCKKGEIATLVLEGKIEKAEAVAMNYLGVFGANFFIELQNNLVQGDSRLCKELVEIADRLDIKYVATNNVHYARPEGHQLHDILVCIKNRTTLDKSGRLRRPNAEFCLKPASEMATIFRDYPKAIENSLYIVGECNVDLNFASYRFPRFSLPDGETDAGYLAKLCREKVPERYADVTDKVKSQINYELDLIEKLGLSGYFLIVWDIMDYARKNGIPAQGRGSAANSIVAYILGITRVDPIHHKLFVGRFINEEMSSIPDIDIDVSTNHRERLIQYVYQKYGEEHTAMVCTYVTFQARNAIREVGKAMGMPLKILDQMAKTVGHYSAKEFDDDLGSLEKFRPYVTSTAWQSFISHCNAIADFPRHLSIHVGGMIISSCPLTEVVPLERAAMPGRVVCQWDKDGIEGAGLVKVDVLGLRMLSLIQETVELVARSRNTNLDLDKIPLDDGKVYDMICEADTLGVFQVESRAQMQTLPRTRPRSIEDLTVEVAIIRPGPLQGHMVHPYINRRQGKEKVTYPHKLLKPILEETLGVILFQEQVLRCAIAIAGFTPGEADALRRAMSKKRSREAIEKLRIRFLQGAKENGVTEPVAVRVFDTLKGFAEYGFCKSHAAGFALLAYRSAWLKYYYPVEFYAALLNNQPMGFYSPEVIIGDAKRHGVEVLPVDINLSHSGCTIESGKLRLGFRYVKELGEAAITLMEQTRDKGPFASITDFYKRSKLSSEVIQNLIMVGALDELGKDRRELLWELGLLEKRGREEFLFECPGYQVPLSGMTDWEKVAAEYDIQGLSARVHPMQLLRGNLLTEGLLSSSEALSRPNASTVRIAGYVVCRQAPATAKGHVFLTLEDEKGLLNIVIRPDVYRKYRYTVRTEPLLMIEGELQRRDGISNILATDISPLKHEKDKAEVAPAARNFC